MSEPARVGPAGTVLPDPGGRVQADAVSLVASSTAGREPVLGVTVSWLLSKVWQPTVLYSSRAGSGDVELCGEVLILATRQ